jgi:serine/threonine protein kinase/Tfp pilus assembly protein PilF
MVMENNQMIGRKLGSYTILRLLGSGGGANVYLADQPSMFRQVALKVFTQEISKDSPAAYTRFQHELQALASLEHLHILPVYEWGTTDSITYLAMRLAEQSLDNYLVKSRPLPLPEVARMLDQVASALDYAHSKRIIHRDLKPPNILLDAQKNCLLADFGIAYLMETTAHLTPEKVIMGTPMYMSPEQILRAPITAQSDIYSLGMIAYEMICGDPPFQGTTAEVLAQQLHATPPPPSSCRPDLPAAASDAVLRALHKTPSARFESAQAFANVLVVGLGSARPTPPIVITTPLSDERTISMMPTFAPIPNTTDVLPHTKTSANKPAALARRPHPLMVLLVVLLAIGGVAAFALIPRPDKARAEQYNESGMIALQQLDYGVAIDKFQAAIRADPDLAAPYFNLGVAYEERADAGKNDIAAALTAYRQALDRDGHLLLAHYRLAELLLDQKQNEDAFSVIDVGVRILGRSELNPSKEDREALMFMLYTTRARAYWQIGGQSNLNLALNDLQTAFEYDYAVAYTAEAYYIKAQIYETQGKQDEALQAWYNVLANSDPQNARHRAWNEEARQHQLVPTKTPNGN